MYYDGIVLKEAINWAMYNAEAPVNTFSYERDEAIGEALYDAYGVSPSGQFIAEGKYPTILRNASTDVEIELPTHSQGTICRGYLWNEDEQYILTQDGTFVSGGGCNPPVLGVTDQYGELWRELGGCSWNTPACFGWLPEQVNLSSLPSGQLPPIQLDPIAYEPIPDNERQYGPTSVQNYLRCDKGNTRYLVSVETGEVVATLMDPDRCPYAANFRFADVGIEAVTAFEPRTSLIATYTQYSRDFVSVWMICDGVATHLLELNSDGYELQFTPDGEYLRAINFNAWKVYSVDDILEYANFSCP